MTPGEIPVRLAFFLIVSVVAFTAWQTPALASDYRLSPQGFGPILFGMSPQQASRAAGTDVEAEQTTPPCSLWTVPGASLSGAQLIALHGQLSYILIYQRGLATTRRIKVGDGLKRLRHRYRGKLRHGHSASLSGASLRLFTDLHKDGTTYTIEFDIEKGHIAFISAGSRDVIETFGECS
jgi:hypothetical protein